MNERHGGKPITLNERMKNAMLYIIYEKLKEKNVQNKLEAKFMLKDM